MTANLNIEPDIKLSVKQTFGIDSEMQVDAFSENASTSISLSKPKVWFTDSLISGVFSILGVNSILICIF